jgi:outer membrane protein assembly factor BamA
VEYLMGGVDNWIAPQNSSNANQSLDPNYGFQTLATSLRGYDQYARIGNNFAVFSTELRLPVLTTFMKRPIQSAILKNLQVVAFMDAGSAWKGFLPDANSTSSPYIFPRPGGAPGAGNVILSLQVPNDDGLALGYGAGLRTSIFGYFVRFDCAWNIDGIKKPVVYFALGTDF